MTLLICKMWTCWPAGSNFDIFFFIDPLSLRFCQVFSFMWTNQKLPQQDSCWWMVINVWVTTMIKHHNLRIWKKKSSYLDLTQLKIKFNFFFLVSLTGHWVNVVRVPLLFAMIVSTLNFILKIHIKKVLFTCKY